MEVNYKEKSIKKFNRFKQKEHYKKKFNWYYQILNFLNKFKDEKYLLIVFYNMIKDSIYSRYIISDKLKTTILVSLFYVITPFDAILDTVPFLGYLDDAFIINLVYTTLKEEVDDYAIWYYNKYKERTD